MLASRNRPSSATTTVMGVAPLGRVTTARSVPPRDQRAPCCGDSAEGSQASSTISRPAAERTISGPRRSRNGHHPASAYSTPASSDSSQSAPSAPRWRITVMRDSQMKPRSAQMRSRAANGTQSSAPTRSVPLMLTSAERASSAPGSSARRR